jgi:LPS O-antigen subunit length determinant protein (WzzB/FepE family)
MIADKKTIVIVCLVAVVFILLVQTCHRKEKIEEVPLVKIQDKSAALLVKNEYLQKEIKLANDSLIIERFRIDSVQKEFLAYRKYIESKSKKQHEKYTAIGSLDGIGIYDFFASINTGDSSKGR